VGSVGFGHLIEIRGGTLTPFSKFASLNWVKSSSARHLNERRDPAESSFRVEGLSSGPIPPLGGRRRELLRRLQCGIPTLFRQRGPRMAPPGGGDGNGLSRSASRFTLGRGLRCRLADVQGTPSRCGRTVSVSPVDGVQP